MIGIILAAGRGTRMRSGAVPKVLLPVHGHPILERIISQLPVDRIIVVVSEENEQLITDAIAHLINKRSILFAIQKDLGTGGAVRAALQAIPDYRGRVLICCGDMPIFRSAIVSRLEGVVKTTTAFGFAAFTKEDPTGYGRVIVSGDGKTRIVEEKDATESERAIRLVNGGLYLFPSPLLRRILPLLSPNNAQGELYITDAVRIGQELGGECRVCTVDAPMSSALEGVNTREELDAIVSALEEPVRMIQDSSASLEEVVQLLGHLTTAPYDNERCRQRYIQITSLHPWIRIYVVHNELIGLMAVGTLVVEPKFIHDCGMVGRIEDVVVEPSFRACGIGSRLIEHLMADAKEAGCYKVTLDAGDHNAGFYKGLGFTSRERHYEHRFAAGVSSQTR